MGKKEGDKLGCHLCVGHLTENTCPLEPRHMAEKPAKGPFGYGKGSLQGPQSGNQSKVCQGERELGITAG